MLTALVSVCSFSCGSYSDTDSGSGSRSESGNTKLGHLFSTLWAEWPADEQLGWSASIRRGSALAWGPACKAAASFQRFRPTGRASSMREYYRAAVLSVCPGHVSAPRVARRGPLVHS